MVGVKRGVVQRRRGFILSDREETHPIRNLLPAIIRRRGPNLFLFFPSFLYTFFFSFSFILDVYFTFLFLYMFFINKRNFCLF